MKKISKIIVLAFVLLSIGVYAQQYKWYKGNTHAHTTNSDGNVSPEEAVKWYKSHDYNFLIITDHNYLTEIDNLDTDKNDNFLLIPGEEVTDSYDNKPVHIVAINVNTLIPPQHGESIVNTLQNNIDAIIKTGGIPQIAHPNFGWAFTDKEISQLQNLALLEIYNFHPYVNNYGGENSQSTEEIWDNLLSKGIKIYGVATDDTHNYTDFTRFQANPGRGWIMVKAKELTSEAITNSLINGNFYISSGVSLENIIITKNEITVHIKQRSNFKYKTKFIGKNGEILKRDYSLKPSYKFKGTELYIRAKTYSSAGFFACTQPVFIR